MGRTARILPTLRPRCTTSWRGSSPADGRRICLAERQVVHMGSSHDRGRGSYGHSMTAYSGPATLILVDGARVSGMASLGSNNRGDLTGWSGTFRPDQVSNDLRNATDGLQLELPY